MKKTMTLWNSKADNILRSLITAHGYDSWTEVANEFNVELPSNKRSAQECKCRWDQMKNLNLKDPWTEEEELKLLIAYKKYKNRWASVAEAIKRKDNNSVKNRFYSIFRRIKNKIIRKDFSSESRLELPMINFVITLMEEHLSHPLTANEKLRRRGKDYIYSLLRQLEVKELKKYKQELQKRNLLTLDELYKEIQGKKETESINEQKVQNEDLSPEIPEAESSLIINKKVCYELPLPTDFKSAKTLTNDEKYFIMSQVFKKTEIIPASLPAYLSAELTSAIQSPAFFPKPDQLVSLKKYCEYHKNSLSKRFDGQISVEEKQIQ